MPYLRPFQTGDMKTLIDTWNQSLVADPINEQRFISNIIGDPAMESQGLPVIVDDAGDVIAFGYATVSWDAVGWINSIGVRPDKQGRGYGSQCMVALLKYLIEHHCQSVNIAAFPPNYILPGVDVEKYSGSLALFKKFGFLEGTRVVSMHADLQNFQVPVDIMEQERNLRSEGIMIESLTGEFLISLLEFIRRDLNSSAYQVIRQALAFGRNINQIFISHQDNHVMGYCMYGIYDGNLERFGPFGVREDQRGKHLGKILLYRCMQAMKAQGLAAVWFKSTIESSPAWHLYRRAGFRTTRRFVTLHRTL